MGHSIVKLLVVTNMVKLRIRVNKILGRVLDHQFSCPTSEAESLLKDVLFLTLCLLIVDLHAPPNAFCRRTGDEFDLDQPDGLQPPGQNG